MNRFNGKFFIPLFCIVCSTIISFNPAFSNGWTSWDDDIYVTDNPVIQQLSIDHVWKAFTSVFNG
ncbi:MAG: hypothetical protein WCX28_13150, partial [Bacteriovoracaceae bacterium]